MSFVQKLKKNERRQGDKLRTQVCPAFQPQAGGRGAHPADKRTCSKSRIWDWMAKEHIALGRASHFVHWWWERRCWHGVMGWWLLRGGRIVVRKFRKIGLWCEMSQSYIIQGNIWFTGRLSQRFRVHHLVKHRSKLVDFWRQVFGRTIWSFEKQSRQRENNVSWQAIIYRAPLLGWRDLAAPKESAIRLFLKLQIFYPFKLYFLKLAPKARNGFC